MLLKIILIWNIIVFFIYGYDKRQAKMQGRRISEKCLILISLFLGGMGAVMGMEIFRHKTKHLNFRIVVPTAAVFTFIIVLLCIYGSIK
ncbi:MAG: DUF1294 domain-containing protein [Clostridia bacterium]|nr:DUF1294 domain-containing protein [Clostridia bacterium]